MSVIGTPCKRATRPCHCGYLGHESGKCRCTPAHIARYRDRISGPLLDRIDLLVEVPALAQAELDAAERGESSAKVRERVHRAREAQLARQGRPNGQLPGREAEERGAPDAAGRGLLREATARLQLSARAHHRVLKVARTIADLEGAARVAGEHVAEALRYRAAFAAAPLPAVTA